MYGPVATRWVPYSDGLFSSIGLAYSGGTGVDSGRPSASPKAVPVGLVSLKTIVWSSGVTMPSIGLPSAFLAASSAPWTSPKYAPA